MLSRSIVDIDILLASYTLLLIPQPIVDIISEYLVCKRSVSLSQLYDLCVQVETVRERVGFYAIFSCALSLNLQNV